MGPCANLCFLLDRHQQGDTSVARGICLSSEQKWREVSAFHSKQTQIKSIILRRMLASLIKPQGRYDVSTSRKRVGQKMTKAWETVLGDLSSREPAQIQNCLGKLVCCLNSFLEDCYTCSAQCVQNHSGCHVKSCSYFAHTV